MRYSLARVRGGVMLRRRRRLRRLLIGAMSMLSQHMPAQVERRLEVAAASGAGDGARLVDEPHVLPQVGGVGVAPAAATARHPAARARPPACRARCGTTTRPSHSARTPPPPSPPTPARNQTQPRSPTHGELPTPLTVTDQFHKYTWGSDKRVVRNGIGTF